MALSSLAVPSHPTHTSVDVTSPHLPPAASFGSHWKGIQGPFQTNFLNPSKYSLVPGTERPRKYHSTNNSICQWIREPRNLHRDGKPHCKRRACKNAVDPGPGLPARRRRTWDHGRARFSVPTRLSKAGVCSELGGHRLCSFQFFWHFFAFSFSLH